MRENNDQVMNSSNKQTTFEKKKKNNQLKWLVVLMKSSRVQGQRSKVKAVSEVQTSTQTLALNLAMFAMEYKLTIYWILDIYCILQAYIL